MYDPYKPFIVPMGLPPQLQAKIFQASQVFRMFDSDRSGNLSRKEWRHAMHQMGYYMNDSDAETLFYMIDTDHSGKISEREFCEFWVSNT